MAKYEKSVVKQQNVDLAEDRWILGAVGMGIVLPFLSILLSIPPLILVEPIFGEIVFPLFVFGIVVLGNFAYGWLSGISPLLLALSSAGGAVLTSAFIFIVLEPLTTGELFLFVGLYLISVVAFVVGAILYWIVSEAVTRDLTGQKDPPTGTTRNEP